MRKARIAEWILQLVCPSERAESTVGDLVESAATRGNVWFWASVWRTAGSHLLQGLISDPRKILGLAVRGFLYSLWLLVLCFLGLLVLSAALGLAVGMSAHSGWWRVPYGAGTIVDRISSGIGLTVAAFSEFQVGRWVARRAPGRELAACLATILLPLALELLPGLAITLATREHSAYNMIGILYQFPCLLGAIWVRKRATS